MTHLTRNSPRTPLGIRIAFTVKKSHDKERYAMRDELQNKLFEAGPILYSLRNLPVTECLMCWGICCPDEWFDVIYELTLKLEKYNETHPYQPVLAAQVKEKSRTAVLHTAGI
jgi:hypothetical protein